MSEAQDSLLGQLQGQLQGQPQRTDPRSFMVRAIAMLGQLVIPAVIGAFAIFDDGETRVAAAILVPLILAVIAANVVIAWLKWRRLTYCVGEQDIRVESGIVSRAARSVPYERIQDVSLEQKLLPRLFGLVEVRFETGAGGKDELALAFLSAAEGERLRELVRDRRAGKDAQPVRAGSAASGDDVPEADEEGQVLFAMGLRRLVTAGVFNFSLAAVAVLFGVTQEYNFLLPFEPWDLDAWQELLAGQGAWLAGLGLAAQAIGLAIALLLLAVLGFATGIARTVARDWGFVLTRTTRGFRRRRGLLTRTDVVMPVHRVQAVNIGTGLLRRLFGWYQLEFVSLAQDAASSSHVVAPLARMAELEPIVREAGLDPPSAGLDWHRASRAHRNALMIVNALVLSLIGLAVLAIVMAGPTDAIDHGGWLVLLPFAAGALLVIREFWLWRIACNALSETQILSRSGWLAPSISIANRVKLQSVEIAQGPIARRLGYATLHLGLAGGTLAMAAIPLDRARELRRAILDSIAERDFSAIA